MHCPLCQERFSQEELERYNNRFSIVAPKDLEGKDQVVVNASLAPLQNEGLVPHPQNEGGVEEIVEEVVSNEGAFD